MISKLFAWCYFFVKDLFENAFTRAGYDRATIENDTARATKSGTQSILVVQSSFSAVDTNLSNQLKGTEASLLDEDDSIVA